MKLFPITIVIASMLVACGTKQEAQERETSRTEYWSYDVPDQDLPEIEMNQLNEDFEIDTDSSLSLRDNKSAEELKDLLKEAGDKLKQLEESGKSYIASGVGIGRYVDGKKYSCTYVEIQEVLSLTKRKTVAMLQPTSQPSKCHENFPRKVGLSGALMGAIIKVGSAYAGGIGAGVVWHKDSRIAGCAAGAGGYHYNGDSAGGAFAFCTKIYDLGYSY